VCGGGVRVVLALYGYNVKVEFGVGK